jgi:cytochrome P450 family 9
MYTIRDPELIKQIAIKDFDHFPQHRMIMNPESDPLFMKSLFALTGTKWQHMRITLSPAFTSSKMRNMFGLMSNCGKKLIDFIRAECTTKGRQQVEMKEFFSRIANDIIATCAFGIEVDSFKEKNNQFFSNGERLRNFQSPLFALKFLGFLLVPWLMKILKVGIIDKTASSYFSKMLEQNFVDRGRHNIIRHDMVHLLLQAKKGNLKASGNELNKVGEGFAAVDEVLQSDKTTNQIQWTDDELIAQCFIFFFAGFESISSFLPFLAYEVVAHPDIQKKLFNEIQATNAGLENNELTYEALNQMKYLDMVVSEALRKWPPTIGLDRLCTKDYKMQHNGHDLVIEKDALVMFPVYALHQDPKYFPDPEQFIPERFDDDNKRNIVTGSYLPFGIGPRNCIGK